MRQNQLKNCGYATVEQTYLGAIFVRFVVLSTNWLSKCGSIHVVYNVLSMGLKQNGGDLHFFIRKRRIRKERRADNMKKLSPLYLYTLVTSRHDVVYWTVRVARYESESLWCGQIRVGKYELYIYVIFNCFQVDMSKVNLDIIKPWINRKVTEMLGFEDDVVIGFVFNQLEERVSRSTEGCFPFIYKKTNIYCM